MAENFVFAAQTKDVLDKKPLCLVVNGRPIAIAKNKGEFYAVENQCTHAASSFDGGRTKAHFIVCPMHGVMFDMKSGVPRGQLAKQSLKTYAVRVVDESELWIDIDS